MYLTYSLIISHWPGNECKARLLGQVLEHGLCIVRLDIHVRVLTAKMVVFLQASSLKKTF